MREISRMVQQDAAEQLVQIASRRLYPRQALPNREQMASASTAVKNFSNPYYLRDSSTGWFCVRRSAVQRPSRYG